MENGFYSTSSEASSVSSINTSDDVEVKKLKDLVKKLEKQNEHLRHRTGKLSTNANKFTKRSSDISVAGGDAFSLNHSTGAGIFKPAAINGFTDDSEDLEVIDENDPIVKSVLNGDEFTWLYQSPRASQLDDEDDKYASPVQWLYDEMEHPKTPQLAAARKNILYKMGLAERGSPDLSYLTETVEKRLIFHPDDYKMEDATDVKVVARLQQEELSNAARANDLTDHSSLANNHHHRINSFEGSPEKNSPGYTHHLPVPSQTMTTAHGLYPAHFDTEATNMRGRRSHTPTSNSTINSVGSSPRANSPSRARSPARAKSPARSRQGKSPTRRSLPNPSRISSSSSVSSVRSNSPSRSSLPAEHSRDTEKLSRYNGVSQVQQPAIRSSLVAPGRMSRLQQKSALPSPGSSSGIPSVARTTTTSPRAASPKTTQRRSLPRPSQASSNLRYTTSRLSNPAASRIAKTAAPPRAPSPAQADLWGEDEVY